MRRAALASLAVLISACSSSSIEDLIPQDGPSMVEIYNSHLQKAAGNGPSGNDVLAATRREAIERSAQTTTTLDPINYTRDAENEIDNLFPTLENPDLVMHVFPHLATDERLPVPGYSTSFPLFERDEFALPGEAAQPKPPARAKPKIRFIGGGEKK